MYHLNFNRHRLLYGFSSFFFPAYFLVFSQIFSPSAKMAPAAHNAANAQLTATLNHALGLSAAARHTSAPAMMVAVTITSNGPVCAGATLDLSANPSGGTGPYTFQWTGPNGFTSSNQTPSVFNTTTANSGTYNVTVLDATMASASASLAITVNAPATTNAGNDQVLCRGTVAQLAGAIGGSAGSATWSSSVAGGFFSPNANALNATYTPPLNYSGVVTLTLTTNDPAGPCPAAADQLLLKYGNPDALSCNDLISISLDEDCSVVVTADMLMEGDAMYELYTVNIFTLQGQNIGNTITGQYIGQTLKGRVKDNCTGNVCFTDIQVNDALAPTLSCQDIFVPCAISNTDPYYLRDQLGIANAVPTVGENCGPYTLTFIDNWVEVPCGQTFNGIPNLSGYIKRFWTIKDPSNNTNFCTQYVYYQRVGLYDLTLPSDITLGCSSTSSTLPTVTGAPYLQAYGQQFPLHPTAAFCDISATYVDQKITLCAGSTSIIRTWTLVDLCLGGSIVYPQNPLTVVQLINVVDQEGPQFTCPEDITVSTNALDCCASTNLPDFIVEDGCSHVRDVSAVIQTVDIFGDIINTQSVEGWLTTFPGNNLQDRDTLAVMPVTPCLPIGYHIVTYFAEDGCGNTSSCSFNLTVSDGTPPLAVCDEWTQIALGADGMMQLNAASLDNGSYDNCGPVYFKARRKDANGCQENDKFYDFVKFCCEDVGDTVMVILRVYDMMVPVGPVSLTFQEQHSNECEVQVLVEDKLKPVCIPPANVTVNCENFDPSLWAHGMPNAVDNCCLDTITQSVNYANFDTICNRGTIVRTFRAFDCYGNSNICTQRIVVNYKQNYFVKFPDDVMISTCDGTGQYGQPTFYGEDCELLAVSYDDVVFTLVPDACFKIERTWTVINWCQYDGNAGCTYVPNPNPNVTGNHPNNLPGPIVSQYGTTGAWAPTVVKVNPTDTYQTNYSEFWTQDANCYRYKQIIKIVDSQKPTLQCPPEPVEICDLTENDPGLWNDPFWFNPTGGHDLCEAPTDLCVTGTDACSGANVNFRYILFLDLNNDGTMETVVNSINPPAPGSVNVGNANNPNFGGGVAYPFDNRGLPSNQRYQWALQTIKSGNNVTACLRWNTQSAPGTYSIPQLPAGKHKIKWLITDGCGNENFCEYSFTVKDCKPPTILCMNGLSGNIMPTGMMTVYASAFVQSVADNCTPTGQIKISIRKSGTGTGFPVNAQGLPVTELTFSCQELGTQLVEVWAMDTDGNSDFCETYIIVQDNAGNCGQNATVAGTISTENGHGVEDANVELNAQPTNGLPAMSMFHFSNTSGEYHFDHALPLASNYTVMPLKEGDPTNGVTTYDLVLINRHILGLEPLNTPYKMIAADANKSNTITTFDIVELRKLILGIYTELPGNDSWRFVDESYTFPNLQNPFVETFPEVKQVSTLQGDNMEDNFVAVKVGDVNNSSIANTLMSTDDRTAGTAYLSLDERTVRAGETFEVTVKAEQALRGMQTTLNFNELDVVEVIPGNYMTDDNFAVFAQQQAITTSWNSANEAGVQPEFTLRLSARQSGKLSQMLALSSRITKAEAYPLADERNNLALRFNSANGAGTVTGIGFELYQNQPNPFVRSTLIGFHLPEATEALLTVYDETGRTIFSERNNYSKGYNNVLIDGQQLDLGTSLLYYKLETPTHSATRKMVRAGN